jgi:glycerophosphoryl diester phosphodiesterase
MTGREGRIADHTAADIAWMRLAGGDETIPTLSDALTLIGHRAMVHIEIKTSFGEVGPLERRVWEILVDHNGPCCVIGFNPYSHAWFADHHPRVLRGLDSHAYAAADARHLAPEVRKKYARLEHVELARPHFLALSADMLPHPRATALRAKGMPVIAWTIRDPAQWEAVRPHCDNLLFEGFAA